MSDPSIGIHKVAHKHTPDSYFSHFEGTQEELINLTKQNFPLKKAIQPEGAYSVSIPINQEHRFFSGVTKLSRGMILCSQIQSKPTTYARTIAVGSKPVGGHAEVILYSKELLAKHKENCTSCDYEIVSLNVSPTKEPSPLHPYKMAKEMLEGKVEYSAEELAKSVTYWTEHVPIVDTKNIDKYAPINPVVVKYLEEGSREKAIKAHRELTGMNEMDAKVYVRNVQDRMFNPRKTHESNSPWQHIPVEPAVEYAAYNPAMEMEPDAQAGMVWPAGPEAVELPNENNE